MVWIVSYKDYRSYNLIYFGPIFDESLAKRVEASFIYREPQSTVHIHKIIVPEQQEFAIKDPNTHLMLGGVRYEAWFAMSRDYPTINYEIYYGPFLTLHDTASWIAGQLKEQWSHPCSVVFNAMFQIEDDYREIYPTSAEEKRRYY